MAIDANYYLLVNDKDEGDAFIYGGWPNDIPISFFTGDPIKTNVPPIEIKMNEKSQGTLTDNLLLTGRGRVFSKKLLDALKEAGVNNIESYPCTIRNLVSGEIHINYRAVNVIGKIACVDRQKSKPVFSNPGEHIIGFDSIVIDESKIGGLAMFVLEEMPVQLVVHKSVRNAMEKAGITGFNYWDGTL